MPPMENTMSKENEISKSVQIPRKSLEDAKQGSSEVVLTHKKMEKNISKKTPSSFLPPEFLPLSESMLFPDNTDTVGFFSIKQDKDNMFCINKNKTKRDENRPNTSHNNNIAMRKVLHDRNRISRDNKKTRKRSSCFDNSDDVHMRFTGTPYFPSL